jgi:uncharacterized protein YcsI (UPF0317 family)
VQANLIVVPGGTADDFEEFCLRNPRSLPLLERLPLGSAIPRTAARDADLRTDLPRYRVIRDGRLIEERTDLISVWPDDGCAFLLGCSFTFDAILMEAGIPVRHRDAGRNVPMYLTDRSLVPAGRFQGEMVVSLRPIPAADVARARALTESLSCVHGAPIHAGSPEKIGIGNLSHPDFGDPPNVRPGDVPVFWACGVTAENAAVAARLRFAITHAPGHMFVTDLRIEDLRARGPDPQSGVSR